ncbi:MAG: GNAT family N-acetyltransferase [Deltaproteobacteria bacterium]
MKIKEENIKTPEIKVNYPEQPLKIDQGDELQLVPATEEFVEELGRICFEAFKSIHDKHSFQRDFPGPEVAVDVIRMFVERDDFYGVVALINGKPAGSNFLSLSDPTAGVGPITVDPECHSKGIGRALMKDVLIYAEKNHIGQIRLLQDSFNVSSLSLYASLGFDVKEAVALMQAVPTGHTSKRVRPAVEDYINDMDELCRKNYKISRRNEIAAAIKFGFSPLIIERDDRITGYLIPGFLGHGVAETEEDALELISEAARLLPPEYAKFFCPLREHNLYRKLLKSRHRAIKVMNLMSFGTYDAPDEVWMPSVLL